MRPLFGTSTFKYWLCRRDVVHAILRGRTIYRESMLLEVAARHKLPEEWYQLLEPVAYMHHMWRPHAFHRVVRRLAKDTSLPVALRAMVADHARVGPGADRTHWAERCISLLSGLDQDVARIMRWDAQLDLEGQGLAALPDDQRYAELHWLIDTGAYNVPAHVLAEYARLQPSKLGTEGRQRAIELWDRMSLRSTGEEPCAFSLHHYQDVSHQAAVLQRDVQP